MKRFIWPVLLFAAACHTDTTETSVHPTIQTIKESVYASVKVYPEDFYQVKSTVVGTLTAILIEEGQQVEQGQPIFAILPSAVNQSRLINAKINLEEATAQYKGSNNLLDNLEKERSTAEQQFELDSLLLVRQTNLQAQSIGKQIDFERAKLAFEASKNKLQILNRKYLQTEETLRRQYEKAINQVNTEKDNLGDYTITSKITGLVYGINKEAGELITAQDYLAEIGSQEQWVIEMEVDEMDISKIEIGDTVALTLEAYPNQTFRAITNTIAPKKNEKTQTFQVTGTFMVKPPKLYSGLSGEANIVVGEKVNTVVIPSEYLNAGNIVLTEEGEKSVELGVKNLTFVEIISGLDTSDVLIKPAQ